MKVKPKHILRNCPCPFLLLLFMALSASFQLIAQTQTGTLVARGISRYQINKNETIYSLISRMRLADKQSYYLAFAKTIN